MAICPKCNEEYEGEAHECVLAATAPAPAPEPIDEQELKPGEKVGEYVVHERIGQGAFGTVYRAVHPLIGKQAAIKVLARRYSFDARVASRFISEARAVNQIRHPNIIDIFSFGKLADGRQYHIMELLEGRTLENLLEDRGFLPFSEAMAILEPIARALDAAHSKGIAHRDLKPANVFLAKAYDGTHFPKLLDFGIAKLMSDELPKEHQTATGAAVGTPYYMSPEQCRGVDVDHRTDIYAFGVMAYEVLTGRVPFHAHTAVDVLFQHLNAEAIPPNMLRPELPDEVSKVVVWLLAKDREKRPQRALEAVHALESAGKGVPTPVSAPAIDPANAPTSSLPLTRSSSVNTASGPGVEKESSASNPPLVLPVQVSLPPKEAHLGTLPPDAQGVAEIRARPESRGALKIAGAFAGAIVIAAIAIATMDPPEQPAPVAPVAPVAPAPVVPVAPIAPAVPPAPAKVKIEIRETPPGTEVRDEAGTLLATAPGSFETVTSTRSRKLTMTAKGYKTLVLEFVPSQATVLPVQMTKEVKGKVKPKVKPKDGADTLPGFDDQNPQ